MNSIRPQILAILCAFFVGAVVLLSSEQATSEKHLKNIRQLTSGGENAEAYFSFDGKKLILQSTRGDWPCDQIYVMPRSFRSSGKTAVRAPRSA